MHARQDGWTFFTWPVKRGETSTALKQQQRDREREGQCHAHFASEKEEEEAKAVNAMGYASFFTAIAGQGGEQGKLGLVGPICAS